MAEILSLRGVSAGYGEAVVVEDLSLGIAEGESVALLGRNGVGKTTLLATILGLTHLHHGAIGWNGADMARWPTHRRARAGIGWVPQERRMWPSLTVEEHLSSVARPGEWNVARVHKLFPRLAERSQHRGSQLSGGEQQMLAIARALVTNPRLLLLDEPMEGLAPIVVEELADVLRGLVVAGTMAVLIVEQHAELALSLAPRGVVMERGRVVHDGAAAGLLADRVRLDRWLGAASGA
ncbi:MAG TPA: ABC transporter ATP-binding protein [Usitatibacter sp.]|nr:ABC transporter ATP-binding protein [Usitatibacter sp.]